MWGNRAENSRMKSLPDGAYTLTFNIYDMERPPYKILYQLNEK